MEQKKWFIIIPANIILAEDINNTQKLLIGLIHSLSPKGCCYAHNKYLGKLLGISQTSVSTNLSDLVSKGYVERVIIKSETSQVVKRQLLIPKTLLRLFKAPPNENSKGGLLKNPKYNNRTIINDFNTAKKIIL